MSRWILIGAVCAALGAPAAAHAQAEEWSQPTQPTEATEATAAPPAPTPPPPPTAPPAPSAVPVMKKKKPKKTWAETARFFVGARGGLGIAPGGSGAAPTAGLELGVVADEGIGMGLHLLWAANPPGSATLGIPPARWAVGAAADFRWYIQTVRPLTLYPTLSVGFLAGEGLDGRNVVLPMLNPGFGARLRFGRVYGSIEFGAVGLQIPFVAIALGYEPKLPKPEEEEADEG